MIFLTIVLCILHVSVDTSVSVLSSSLIVTFMPAIDGRILLSATKVARISRVF